MRRFDRWRSAWRCWASVLLCGLAGCVALPESAVPPLSPPCTAFVEAWVGHFRAHVAHLDGQPVTVPDLALARAELARQQVAEADCPRPLCIIQPRQGGRLDSYCGYRVVDGHDGHLYRWVPWKPARP